MPSCTYARRRAPLNRHSTSEISINKPACCRTIETGTFSDFEDHRVHSDVPETTKQSSGMEWFLWIAPKVCEDGITTFPFMSLPKELRLNVYEHLLCPDTLQISSRQLRSAEPESYIYHPRYHAAPVKGLEGTSNDWKHPAILQTCKQVYNEAAPLLHRPRQLKLVPFHIFPHTARTHTLDEDLPSKGIIFPPDLLKDIFVQGKLHIELNLWSWFPETARSHCRGFTRHLNEDFCAREISIWINVRGLENALCIGPSVFNFVIADQLAILDVWREGLKRAHLAHNVEIWYTNGLGSLAVWKKKRGGEWKCYQKDLGFGDRRKSCA